MSTTIFLSLIRNIYTNPFYKKNMMFLQEKWYYSSKFLCCPLSLTNLCLIHLQRMGFKKCFSIIVKDEEPMSSYSLTHVRNWSQQKDGVSRSIYLMRFMEQILNREELYLHVTDVPFLRLQYMERILVDGISCISD